ncbi:hypothetical protein CATRI_12445 [Corynebacterium atrinae]|uniref:flagellar motor control protein ZomB n=1 Tax=Corynebacterium atrinae TaxID=1336740 RepID=UPI0025B3ECD8|nr:flagellar motor control protein ZomB [Corynebacterium atrinae]WJY64537.1 hypothetical protein CATRI_12445 [Corynebacterium atrinae]
MTTAVREGSRRAQTSLIGRGTITGWSALAGVLALGVLAFVGGWTRRWMSDDGLIVLRTVRNLLAGNGPVFNAGERVEANTSTLWQYLIYLVALVSDARLEIIAMWLALIFTTAALAIGAWGTARLYRRHHAVVLLPVGGLIYFAVPPARDFATSGLEWGLSLFWIAVLWWLLVSWATPTATSGRHHAASGVDSLVYWLAFWCGLSWLVRPELALYGGLVGLLILIGTSSWNGRALVMAAALPVPLGYQIFRMGYYGLITPHTAVAKSASDAQWANGWAYARDLSEPYYLWIALVLAIAMAAIVLWRLSTSSVPHHSDQPALARTPGAAIGLILLAAALHATYVLRVGGDFMHGRMLLLPLFAALLPVLVLPVLDLAHSSRLFDGALLLAFVGLSWWGLSVVADGHTLNWEEEYGDELGIVDERDFWTFATNREQGDPPLLATDFTGNKALRDYSSTMERAEAEDAALMSQYLTGDPAYFSWMTNPRQDATANLLDGSGLGDLRPTLYHTNLGMTSMNAPLDFRVLDTVGLTTPLAARLPRDEDGRVGHDKWLPFSWQAADTDADIERLYGWYPPEETRLAREALQTPEIADLLATSREPMSWDRFLANLRYSLTEGRTLQIAFEPEEAIKELGPPDSGRRIAWPTEVSLDTPR